MVKKRRKHTGPTFQETREALGLTQQELAKKLGCHVMTISRWENLYPSAWGWLAIQELQRNGKGQAIK